MPEKHLSSQFDSELNSASARVMELGGLVESQLRQAIYALTQFSSEAADQVIETEQRVNAMEVEIDRELSSIIGRRQPTARDLRLLIAISKTTANLEARPVGCRRPTCVWPPTWHPACCARRWMLLPGSTPWRLWRS